MHFPKCRHGDGGAGFPPSCIVLQNSTSLILVKHSTKLPVSVCLSVCMSACLCVCLPLSLCLPVCLSPYCSVCLCFSLSVSPFPPPLPRDQRITVSEKFPLSSRLPGTPACSGCRIMVNGSTWMLPVSGALAFPDVKTIRSFKRTPQPQ